MRLMAILAHPDDESFGTGGTLALYAQRGVRVHLICATRGEVGNVPPKMMQGFKHIAELREHELRCAAQVLGLEGVHFLDYRDSGMPGSPDNQHPRALAATPVDEVVSKLVPLLRRWRPQVVITFDPIGGYCHPDHVAIHHAAVQAFHAAGDPAYAPQDLPAYQPQKLYFHIFPRRLMRWLSRLLPWFGIDPQRFGRNQDIDLVQISQPDYPVHARINYRPVGATKQQASACHASQEGPPSAGLLGLIFRLGFQHDTYMRAHPPTPPRQIERDLFEGITPDVDG
ncbi:MAG TPA: GlcNAc-PI de-N-acetylase [Anaerolineae bacterium]|nr:GlcNAc-PI de-N-acetylase [Anaerolineae bacterium]